MDGLYLDYFSAELTANKTELNIFTTTEFDNYETTNDNTQPFILLIFQCATSGSVMPSVPVRFNITVVNNFEPKFSATNYNIMVPLPLSAGIDLSCVTEYDITAIDYDLYHNEIQFSILGADFFGVESIEVPNGAKKRYKANFFTTQQIKYLDNDELEFTIVAKVSKNQK